MFTFLVVQNVRIVKMSVIYITRTLNLIMNILYTLQVYANQEKKNIFKSYLCVFDFGILYCLWGGHDDNFCNQKVYGVTENQNRTCPEYSVSV